jgi:heme A synthase
MLAYALSLALIAFLLEWVAGHAHRRSVAISTAGFTYHADRDVWKCPKDQHLFPVFSDSIRGKVIYRAPAAACRACPSKAACTDSDHGRELERDLGTVESGMKRFHRAISLTLLALACLIVTVELFRTGDRFPRIVLASTMGFLVVLIQHLAPGLTRRDHSVNGAQ